MSEELTREQKEAIARLVQIVRAKFASGCSTEEVRLFLMDVADLSRESADRLIAIATDPRFQPQAGVSTSGYSRVGSSFSVEKREQGKGLMIRGSIFLFGGLALTAISFLVLRNLGFGIIFTGAIIWGFIDIIRGLVAYLSS